VSRWLQPFPVVLLFLGGIFPALSAADALNYYEWSATAPIVVIGDSLGVHGKFLEVEAREVLRGEVEPGTTLYVRLREANRTRSANIDPYALKPDEGFTFAWLLEPARPRKKDGRPSYLLVRGARGARELPAEGERAVIDALARFIEIQQSGSDNFVWAAFTEMLGERSSILIGTALQQFRKFQRGRLELLFSLRPLLDHPDPAIRQDCGRLIAQILVRHPEQEVPEEAGLRTELVAAARRDDAIDVRVAATQALGRLAPGGVKPILEEIARSDPDQLVRYAAERVLLEWREIDDSLQSPD